MPTWLGLKRIPKRNRPSKNKLSYLRMILFSWFAKYWSGLLFVVFAGFLLWAFHDSTNMHKRAKYTVGYIKGWHPTAKSGIRYDFRFVIADSIYRGSSPSDKGMATARGSRFVVEYDSIHPATSVGYFAVFIPDSIRQAPVNGWRVPPFPIPQWILDRVEEQRGKK